MVSRCATGSLVCLALVGGLAGPASVGSAAGVPRFALAGAIRLPAEAAAADGATVAITGVSGVTWLGDDRWLAVMDTGDGLLAFALDCAADGTPRGIRDPRVVRLAARHDCEDVAVCPPGAAVRFGAAAGGGHVLVCEEDTPAVHVVDAHGAIRGGLPIPAAFATRRRNRGFEALCVAADGTAAWTANEESLPGDGPPPAAGTPTVVRLVELPLDPARARGRQIAYAVEPPHACVPAAAEAVHSGLVALAALPDGRLLALERSAARCLPPFESRLFVVDPATAVDVSEIAGGLAARPGDHVEKCLAWRGSLGCNLEGLALGPALPAGGDLVVGVADAGGLDTPSQLIVLRMEPPLTSP